MGEGRGEGGKAGRPRNVLEGTMGSDETVEQSVDTAHGHNDRVGAV